MTGSFDISIILQLLGGRNTLKQRRVRCIAAVIRGLLIQIPIVRSRASARPKSQGRFMSAFLLPGCDLLCGTSADHQDLLLTERTVREVLKSFCGCTRECHQIDGKLRRGLVKIRTAIQIASVDTHSGDETRYGKKIIKRILVFAAHLVCQR